MNYYALIYETVDDYVERRGEFREQHLRVARESLERGELVFGGAFAEPVDQALLVFRASEKSKVEDFARNDPYVVNGLVKKWKVRPWNVVVGNKEATSSANKAPGTILRQWTARATQEQWPRYQAYFTTKVLTELRKVDGFLEAKFYSRRASGDVEILVETSWRSLESVRAFAGSDLEAAVVSEEATTMLTQYDRRVRHFEIAISARA